MKIKKITFHTDIERKNDLNEELQGFSNAIGLFNERDKERSCFRIFITLLKAKKKNDVLSSEEIALESHLSRGTVIYHINKLMDSGFVIEKRSRYSLIGNNLNELVDYIEKDLVEFLRELKEKAREIDKEL